MTSSPAELRVLGTGGLQQGGSRLRRHSYSMLVVSLPLALGLLLISSCTPEKARALQAAATQFRIEALKAIGMIDEMRMREMAPPPRSQAEAVSDFVEGVMGTSKPLTPAIITGLINPFEVETAENLVTEWDKRRGGLRAQYTEFASIFEMLEVGSYLAGEAVARSQSLVGDLTLQMVAFAKAISEHPPMLIQYRSQLIAEIEEIRGSELREEEEKRSQIAPFLDRWLELMNQEQELGNSTVEQCLRAALLGKKVSDLTRRYSELKLDDLNRIITRALEVAGAVSSSDTQALKQKVDDVITTIKADKYWGGVVDDVVLDLTRAAAGRGGGPTL